MFRRRTNRPIRAVQMSPSELAQMEAAGYGFAQQFATEAATMPFHLYTYRQYRT